MENYVFVRVVGKGSYGEVNLVQHKSDRKQYVIKKLNLRTSSKRERRAAEQEAQLLSQLKHPNIVTYRESWEGEDCQLYIVMGFCEGGDLYHRLKLQKGELLPERQVVEWFVQIAMALQYLHEKHILHRDLKTQNIFLTRTNIIKVGDLGIARVLENQNDMASTLIGTPYYMSPELFSNKPYNYKSDVWALGCCVYEMATLKHAFNAKDMNSLAYRIIEGKLPQMPSKYDPQLGELIKRMLCKRPEDRPDVKHILRQPYIKQQIAIFLEATKEWMLFCVQQERKSSWRSDEEECSSSTSSTERSEGDYREGKSETNEMQDLVQMMTQTLRMDVRDISHSNCATLPEFRLNRKYRDTLMLHGKASEGDSDLHFSDFPSDDSSGPAKIRRAIEQLRADVVKGLGVKLLDKVLDIMQVEDEEKREVLLRQQMGEEKYKNYAVMVQQLKFFEDVAFKD
uniref:Serine/threonine-protein kinase Nek4 n=1 Tax=Pygocentrus nattereri TaxID=42514 RepID=A0AAR2JQ00_PYGNA